jgi:hypothetical protein
MNAEIGEEFVEEEDAPLTDAEASNFSQAVLFSTDWTVETVLAQLAKNNIELNPRFQRRDAWTRRKKECVY